MEISDFFSRDTLGLGFAAGSTVHLYNSVHGQQHFHQIATDFAEGRYISGALRTLLPFLIPYAVAIYSKNKRNDPAEI